MVQNRRQESIDVDRENRRRNDLLMKINARSSETISIKNFDKMVKRPQDVDIAGFYQSLEQAILYLKPDTIDDFLAKLTKATNKKQFYKLTAEAKKQWKTKPVKQGYPEFVTQRQVLPPPLTMTHEQFNDTDLDVAGIVRVNEDGELIKEYAKFQGLTQYIKDIYDDWMANRLHKNIRRDTVISKNGAVVTFSNIKIKPPSKNTPPDYYRRTNGTYAFDVYVDINLWVTPEIYLEVQIEELQKLLRDPKIPPKKTRKYQAELEDLVAQKDELSKLNSSKIEDLRHELEDVKKTDKERARFLKRVIRKLGEEIDMFAKLDDERRRRIIEQYDLREVPGEEEPPVVGMRLLRTKPGILAFSVPLMLGSKECVLYKYIVNKDTEKLKELGEDPLDPFGYFIVNGREKVVLTQEKLRKHKLFLYRHKNGIIAQTKTDTISRGTMITKLIITDELGSGLATTTETNEEEETEEVADKNNLTNNQYIQIYISSQRPDQIEDSDEVSRRPRKHESEVEERKTFRKGFRKPYKGGIKNVYVHFAHIYKILGITDHDTIKKCILMFAPPKHHRALAIQLIPSLHKLEVEDSVEYLTKVLDINPDLDYDVREQQIKFLVESDIIPHLITQPLEGLDNPELDPLGKYPGINQQTKYKIYTLSMMVVALLEYMAGLRSVDDRDQWGNKTLETAGALVEQLVRSAWAEVLKKARKKVLDTKNKGKKIFELFEMFTNSISAESPSTKELIYKSFKSTAWGVTAKYAKNNICQNLEVNNVIAKIVHLRLVDVARNTSSTLTQPREVQYSGFPYICPTKSSEGDKCGLSKAITLTARLSLDRDEGLLLTPIRDNKLAYNYPDETHQDSMVLNSIFIGWCDSAYSLKLLKQMKCNGGIPYDTGIVRTDDGMLHIHTDGGRVIIPELLVNETGTKTKIQMDAKKLRKEKNYNFGYFMMNGYVEYVDPWENEYIMLASSQTDFYDRTKRITNAQEGLVRAREILKEVKEKGWVVLSGVDERLDMKRAKAFVEVAETSLKEAYSFRKYTHMLIDPAAMLSESATAIPLPNNNHGPRNTYQTSMYKQAMAGLYHYNQANRFDGTIKMLLGPTEPMFSTVTEEILGLKERPQGQNVVIAFGSDEYSQEDSFVVKKEFIERGGFMYTKTIEFETEVKNTPAKQEFLRIPNIAAGHQDRYRHLMPNGLPRINSYVHQGDCIIGKVRIDKATNADAGPVSEYVPLGDEGRVTAVNVTKNLEGNIYVRVKVLVHRKPQVADKFANRTSQKGTIGKIEEAINMPFTVGGIVPDIIINSHSVSRITGAYFIELISCIYSSMYGDLIDATAFRPVNIERIQDMLARIGFNRSGKSMAMDGINGAPLVDAVYIGIAYFLNLKHNVRDKEQGIPAFGGPKSALTKQAVSGRKKRGGLRFGDMEVSEVMSHGAAGFLKERLCTLAGEYTLILCKGCRIRAVYQPAREKYVCNTCKRGDNLRKVKVPFAVVYFMNLLRANAIEVKIEPDEYEEQEGEGEIRRKEEEEEEIEIEEELEEIEEEIEEEGEEEQEEEEESDLLDSYDIKEDEEDESGELIEEEEEYPEEEDEENDYGSDGD